jgi:hypothetical protein
VQQRSRPAMTRSAGAEASSKGPRPSGEWSPLACRKALNSDEKRLLTNSALVLCFPPKSGVHSRKGVDSITHTKVGFDQRGTELLNDANGNRWLLSGRL